VEIPVIIEPVAGSGYRVTGAGGLSVGSTAEGTTPAEAIDRLAERVRMRVDAGAKLAELNVATSDAAWKQDSGYLRDDRLDVPWREAMEAYRRQLDEDPDPMSRFVVDTDIPSLYYWGGPTVVQRIDGRGTRRWRDGPQAPRIPDCHDAHSLSIPTRP
jgi:hypothetical protein